MLFLAAAFFVGSQQCHGCHAAIAEAYARTAMARSGGPVESVPHGEFTASGQHYRVTANRLVFDQGSAHFDYFIGSGSHGHSYLFAREGYLFELPVTWYARTGTWDASPGYEHYSEPRLDRPVDTTCLWCHASQVRFVRGTQNRYADPPFADNGVGCERCHGPGSEHVRNPAAARMVNPAKLAPERRDSVCAQCHLTGVSRVTRAGRTFEDFRAGDRLADYATYFVREGGNPNLRVTSHVERLAASGCKRAAGDALWCGTCHDPHTGANRTQAACLSCHAQAHHTDESCAGCHMPKSAAVDAGHGVFTDHSIPRDPTHLRAKDAQSRIAVFLGIDDDRARGIAYAEAGDPKAREFLLKAQPVDSEVRLRLAALDPDPTRAAALYSAVLSSDPANTTALVNLGALYGAAGRTSDAAALWKRALETNPALEGAALNLSRVLPRAEARAVLERYLSFNPGSAAVRKRLEELPRP
jgi:hypothetical protein